MTVTCGLTLKEPILNIDSFCSLSRCRVSCSREAPQPYAARQLGHGPTSHRETQRAKDIGKVTRPMLNHPRTTTGKKRPA